jgi:hypothetical protein
MTKRRSWMLVVGWSMTTGAMLAAELCPASIVSVSARARLNIARAYMWDQTPWR